MRQNKRQNLQLKQKYKYYTPKTNDMVHKHGPKLMGRYTDTYNNCELTCLLRVWNHGMASHDIEDSDEKDVLNQKQVPLYHRPRSHPRKKKKINEIAAPRARPATVYINGDQSNLQVGGSECTMPGEAKERSWRVHGRVLLVLRAAAGM